ncbi:hypothetical protein FHT76_001560 [Rhizobium sp. BK176]|nr:hypothetical protein [Rhizobium sp. BK176]
MLVLIFAVFGAFLTDMVPAVVESSTPASYRAVTADEMKTLLTCQVGETHLVVCRLP